VAPTPGVETKDLDVQITPEEGAIQVEIAAAWAG
jgi:hypothetical protein